MREPRELIVAFDLPQMWNAVMQTTISNMSFLLNAKKDELDSEDGLDISLSEEVTVTFKRKFSYFLARKIERVSKTVVNHRQLEKHRLKIVLIRDCSRKFNWRSLLIDNRAEDEDTPYKRVRNSRKRRFTTNVGVLEINVPPLLIMINEVIEDFSKKNLISFKKSQKVNLFRLQIQNEDMKLVDGREVKVGVEADDIIAIMCQCVNREKAHLVAISNDTDFCQLLDRFSHFDLYNIKGIRQTIGYNSCLVPHLIALKGKRSSGLKTLLKPSDFTQIKNDIKTGRIRKVEDLTSRLLGLIQNPETSYNSNLWEELEYSLNCISFKEMNKKVKNLIVNRLREVAGLIS